MNIYLLQYEKILYNRFCSVFVERRHNMMYFLYELILYIADILKSFVFF